MKVANKVIVVTGGGSGMGRELVLKLLAKNAKVVTIDINENSLQETARLAGNSIDSLTTSITDITNRNAVEELLKNCLTKHGHVDAIINNAGIIQPFVKIIDLDYASIERVMHINFYGTLYMTKTFLPHLLTRPEAHVMNISSMGGFLPVPGQTLYGASKAAVKLFTEGLYAELAGTKVGVTVVFPGAVNTNISRNSGVEMPARTTTEKQSVKMLSAGKAAHIMIEAMERNRYRVLVGNDARLMDFFYRLNPKSAVGLITKRMRGLLAEK